MKMLLSEMAAACGAVLQGPDCMIDSVSIDSRAVKPGALFVAIAGDRVDGHDYAAAALAAGAAAVLSEKPVAQAASWLLVDNSVAALTAIAAAARRRFVGRLIALTGSSGKTSTKEMLAAILAEKGRVSVTSGNQNNEIGVPLTLLAIDEQADYAVVEMGAAQRGDIRHLMALADPDLVAITNVGQAHIGRFGSAENIASAKAEIYRYLKSDGMAVINVDDKQVDSWRQILQGKAIIACSSAGNAADVMATDIELESTQSRFELHYRDQQVSISLAQSGRHNVSNAACAAACALAVGANLQHVVAGLARPLAVTSRLQHKAAACGALLIDDSYNANPDSVRAAIDVLAAFPGRRYLVLGDMAELGELSGQYHREMGNYARQKQLTGLFSCGIDSAMSSQAFADGGEHFVSKQQLAERLQALLVSDDVVLIKGSRSAGMEDVVERLQQKAAI